jgi:nitrite reductase (NADH) small subunit
MNERCWIWVTEAENIPPREGRSVTVEGREIAVFNLGGDRFLATLNRCPHKAGPLADGIVAGNSVVCPLHGWKISLETGRVDRPSGQTACVETFPARIDNGTVVLGLPAAWFARPIDGAA